MTLQQLWSLIRGRPTKFRFANISWENKPMDECQKDISQVVRGAVLDTLKISAPGISETMRAAIAQSVVLKVKKVFETPQPS